MSAGAIRILLIEDNPGDARLVERYLEQDETARFEIRRAGRLAQGIEQLQRGPTDLVLLDLSLPDSNGFETFERAKAAAPDVPIVVMTGRDDSQLALKAVRDGAQDYLVKRKVGSDSLVRSIRYAIERKQFEEALRESEERFSLAVDGANDGVWDWDLRSHKVFYSRRWKEMLGYGPTELDGSSSQWLERVHPADRESLQHDLDRHLEGRSQHFRNEHRMQHRDGSYRWMLSRGVAVRDKAGKPYRIAGSLTDVHLQKMTEQQLLHDAMHDALTELPNWALFMDRLGVTMAQSRRRPDELFAILFLDLDRFKNINDSLGHASGDLMLVSIARRLRAVVRPGDTVARLGGDEFAILLEGIEGPSDATRVANRVNAELGRSFDLQGHEVFASASIGIALSSSAYERAQDMLRDADTAMYRAKSTGKARHSIFDEEMHRKAVQLLQLETDLRRALKRSEFQVHYQPIIDLASGRIEGFEALVRWLHPEKGLVMPDEFISVAEETGMMLPIDWIVIHEACRQTSEWRRRYPAARDLGISVNLSGRELTQPDLVDRIRDVLAESDTEPKNLRLEITEGMIIKETESAAKKLVELDEIGVGLHMDDFGTGYSSLSYLHSLPLHAIKIDRSFISHLNGDNGRSQIVSTIVTLARSLGMKVAAEGLERPEHVQRMRELSCDFGQGYFFSRPVDAETAGQLLASDPHW